MGAKTCASFSGVGRDDAGATGCDGPLELPLFPQEAFQFDASGTKVGYLTAVSSRNNWMSNGEDLIGT